MARKNVKDKSEEGSRDIVPYKKNVGDLRAEFYGIMCLGRQSVEKYVLFFPVVLVALFIVPAFRIPFQSQIDKVVDQVVDICLSVENRGHPRASTDRVCGRGLQAIVESC